ncbi:LysR family transcriptional regulator [Bradyrhizobium sp. CCGB01]|uniref:LysR family transcriptional regulator n=1 Tax=Bradyrhizobium sp. CCGB01 TaxID=2949634 RepID=UPI0020B25CAE|nr:LysR family transcriptional regulator [Bradyrhizobium sp. CCGB01]MCP3404757.1 LysR family transcriptional regulator [Bradyrhizobium sp. CCGB01]
MIDLVFDLRYLRCALSAAEQGSIRRAAQILDLSQSTVTRRVQLLERRLGFQLFVRDRRGVKLTVAGTGFLKDAIAGAQHLDRAVRLGAAVYHGELGELRIGILVSPISGLLHDAFRTFREQQPLVRVLLKEGTSLELLHGLAMGELDVAFVTGNINLEGYNEKLLWNETVFAALPCEHKLALKDSLSWGDFHNETFLVSRSGLKLHDYLAKKLGRQGSLPRVDVHDVSQASVFDLIAMRYGITLVTSSSVRSDLAGVVFRPVAGEITVLTSAVWTQTTPALRRLVDLTQTIAQNAERETRRSPRSPNA